MRKYLSTILFLLFVILTAKFTINEKTDAAAPLGERETSPIALQVGENTVIEHPSRIGINLDRWTSWGTQQLSNNIIMNPGFEGSIERALIIVSQSDEKSFSDEAGLGLPDSFWSDAEFDVRSGISKGKRGIIRKSLLSGALGFPQYISQEPLPPLEVGDVIVLTKIYRHQPAPHWSIKQENLVQLDPYETRTDSNGTQSARLRATKTTPAEMHYFADTLAEKTGKMFVVKGPWLLSLWAKAEKPEAELHILFKRGDSQPPFIKQTVNLSTSWNHYTFKFNGKDDGPPTYFELVFSSQKPDVSIWIDDVYLGRDTGQNTAFKEEVIQVLKLLNPSYLREFPSLGNTFENHIAPQFSRKSWGYQITADRRQAIFNYSLVDFLALCKEVKANPWLVIPPTFSDYECMKLGEFLAKNGPKDTFSDIIVEFGAENWNWLNRPFTIPYEKQFGNLADRAFEIIAKETERKSNVRFLVSEEFAPPPYRLRFLSRTKRAQGVGVAPYFFHSLEKATPDDQVLKKLFESSHDDVLTSISQELFADGKFFSIYEINLHTTGGNAKGFERNRVVAGAAAGSALAKEILESLFAGADPIMIHNLAQFHTPTWEINDFVNLWGITRDFGPPPLLRPTGLAVMMLNRIIKGDMHPLLPNISSLKKIRLTCAAFNTKSGWTAALISANEGSLEIELQFPNDTKTIPHQLLTLAADSPFDTNEFEEKVKVVATPLKVQGRGVRFTIPPYGFVVLE